MPKVSIITFASNLTSHLTESVNSIFRQTFTDWELLVATNKANSMPDLVQSFNSPKVKVLLYTEQGRIESLNSLLLVSSSKYVAILDVRDQWQPGKLQQQTELMDSDGDLSFCCTRLQVVCAAIKHASSQSRVDDTSYARLLALPTVLPSSVLIRRSDLALSGFFDTLLPSCQEYDLILKLARLSRGTTIDSCEVYRQGTEEQPLEAYYSVLESLKFIHSNHLLKAKLLGNKELIQACKAGVRTWESGFARILLRLAINSLRTNQPLHLSRNLVRLCISAPYYALSACFDRKYQPLSEAFLSCALSPSERL